MWDGTRWSQLRALALEALFVAGGLYVIAGWLNGELDPLLAATLFTLAALAAAGIVLWDREAARRARVRDLVARGLAPPEVRCTACGAANPRERVRCLTCGRDLPPLPAVADAAGG